MINRYGNAPSRGCRAARTILHQGHRMASQRTSDCVTLLKQPAHEPTGGQDVTPDTQVGSPRHDSRTGCASSVR